jgi:integrase
VKQERSAKRIYGTGSVTHRGGAWHGVWWVDGKRVKRSLGRVKRPGVSEGLTRKQAEARLRQKIAEYTPPEKGEVVLFSDAGTLHVNRLEALGRRASTIETYRSYKREHLDPDLGTRPVASITPHDIDRLQQKLLRKGSPKSVRNWMSLCHGILAFAERREWVSSNAAASVEKPKVDENDEEIHFLNHVQLEKLLRTCADDAIGRLDKTLYLVAAMTGLRESELLDLRWRHVDWPAAKIRIFKTKSRKMRSVPLAERAARELEHHFQRSAYQGDDQLVFVHPDSGRRLDRSRVLKRLKANLTSGKIGEFEERTYKGDKVKTVPVLTFHDLRHTFGTTCAAAGIPLRTIMEWMGHKDIKTTMVYAHYAPSDEEAKLIERAFDSEKITDAGALLEQATRDTGNGGQMGDNLETTMPSSDQVESGSAGTDRGQTS